MIDTNISLFIPTHENIAIKPEESTKVEFLSMGIPETMIRAIAPIEPIINGIISKKKALTA
ncbi:MAG: hypothetical protein Sw2LagPseu_35420 [Shewanella algae]